MWYHRATVALLFTALAVPSADTLADDDEAQFLALLDEQTAIATRTRMNADYVPGMVTVLHGRDLEARGARTVWEAMALVPGMETAVEQKSGRRKVLVRGLGNTWASGNLKVLLNDVAMNSAELGLANPVFNMSIEQVERIEVIRGPGSAIYGEFAYMGVVNVVTHAEQSKAYAFGGSFNTRGGGIVTTLTEPEAPLQASLNLAAWRSSGADVETGPDILYAYGKESVSRAPGRANEEVEAGTAVFRLAYQGFALTAQWTEDGIGDHFGTNYTLPPDPNRVVERSRHRTVDARQEVPFTATLTGGVHLGWSGVERWRDDLFAAAPLSETDSDHFLTSRYEETHLRFGGDLHYRGWHRHTLLLAAEASKVNVEESWTRIAPPLPGANPTNAAPGTQRRLTAVTLQDEFRHGEVFTLTTGLRYDDYSDVGSNYSPRIAGVWRLNPRHILKAQYAEAFRPPTFLEMKSAIKPATVRTSELGYVFKGGNLETKVTLFHSRLNDVVVFQELPGFGNEGLTAAGAEWEQRWRPVPAWALDANLAYVQTRDRATGAPFPGAATWLTNGGVSYTRGPLLTMLQAHHVDGYEREAADPRPPLSGYTTVDIIGTLSHVGTRGLTWRLGVKNIFDARVRYPSPVVPDPDLGPVISYPGDYPQAGRRWWTQWSYRF